jgi:endonuclease/exonuclease/phosphatase family metal-dependent hydrolase
MRPIASFSPAPLRPAHHQPRKGATVTVATVNDDFTDSKTSVPRVRRSADVLLVQEAKNTRVRGELSRDTFGVHQNFKDTAQAGAAIAWKREVAHAVDSGEALASAQGHGILARWINFTDMTIDGQRVRMISVHRPPARAKALWPEFDRHLAAFVKRHKGPVIIGLDANQRDPQRLAHMAGLRWVAPKGSIDGFLVSPRVHVESMWRLPKGASDHAPVVAKFRIRPGGAQ